MIHAHVEVEKNIKFVAVEIYKYSKTGGYQNI